jgi:ketosteroid isomerase-like protein
MRDGKIQEVREYMDTLYLRDAISDLTAVAA